MIIVFALEKVLQDDPTPSACTNLGQTAVDTSENLQIIYSNILLTLEIVRLNIQDSIFLAHERLSGIGSYVNHFI